MKPCERIPVIVRSWNNRSTVEQTLLAVRAQTVPAQIIGFDNDSEDGTKEIMRELADELVRVPRGRYIPGRVLNEAMARSRGEIVVFLNADCTPRDRHWLEGLLEAMEPPYVAAAYSRQLPRPGCHALEALDIDRCYGDAGGRRRARHTFSMASSAVRRTVWESFPFDRELRYSEDVHWTWRARRRGHRIAYAPRSEVFHSHDYSLGQLFRRYRGEGRAEAAIFDWSRWQRNLLRYSVLPWGRSVVADWNHCARRGLWKEAIRSPVYRAVQAIGRRRGFLAGLAAERGEAS